MPKPLGWVCDQCGWDSRHDTRPHEITCFVMNPSALRPIREHDKITPETSVFNQL